MRFAFISDIHSNLQALELVLADLERRPVDQLVCLGDVVSLGPQPREVLARIRALNIPVVTGNHDAYLLDLQLTENHLPWLRAAEQWCLAQLGPEDLDFMRTFQPHLTFALDEQTEMLCYHGTTRSHEEWLYPTTPAEVLDELLVGQTAAVLVGGHAHVQMTRMHRGRLFINPGSVGMPLEFPRRVPAQRVYPWAEYAILEMDGGVLSTELRRLPIDMVSLEQVARDSGMPDVDFWLAAYT